MDASLERIVQNIGHLLVSSRSIIVFVTVFDTTKSLLNRCGNYLPIFGWCQRIMKSNILVQTVSYKLNITA
ncbi:unnamed protein product [Acanthoscelides obtectus]|uniref:Uncharacterized protein n=1 Tax=Acanthoscelides obtectus TaxID=200917 RepID=A0A9P0P432_ACAOB|nr:unnamed protein product [Acanthoscelides obtectus]CAK1648085.1 hypothetical protein AOBTE_LOCUS15534 [Acanthoscelides obtectus]